MKIAYLASDFGLVSETFITDLATGLAKSGQVTVFCSHGASINVPNLSVEEIGFVGVRSLADRIGLRVDKLRAQQGGYRTYQRYLDHAYRKLYPALRHYQPDVAYIDYGTTAALARAALQALKIPFVVHFHGADITSGLNDSAYRQELQNVFRDAAGLVVASEHMRRLLILEGAPADKIRVVRLGIDLEGLEPMSWERRSELPPSIVFLGRFTPKKHPVALVQAFSLVKQQVPDAQLSMVGDGPEMSRVKHRIAQLDLENSVTLHGALPRHEALSIVNRHWVYAQHSVTAPSGDQEGFGVSLAEAAALGLPVVSTWHNGIPEQVVHGETGFLVREFDYETMAFYLGKLLSDTTSIKAIGIKGRIKADSNYSGKQRTHQIKEVIDKI